MTARVRFRPQAQAELEEARAWYEARLSGLGRDFVEAVDASVGRIAEMPQAFSPLRSDVR
jgi:toxin ParE1/3/4